MAQKIKRRSQPRQLRGLLVSSFFGTLTSSSTDAKKIVCNFGKRGEASKIIEGFLWPPSKEVSFYEIFRTPGHDLVDLCTSISHKYIPEFNDKLIFDISWKGSEQQNPLLKGRQSVIINTLEKEKYQCFLPKISADDKDNANQQNGIPAEMLLHNLISQKTKCSYRLEPYWTYEVCHGLHVRQFHEEKGVGTDKIKLQEYFLGRAEIVEQAPNSESENENEKPRTKAEAKVPAMIINGRNTPYYNVSYGNGTPCDITGQKPRMASILYICHESANNEIVSVKEVTTCEYEVLILNSDLCNNPAYIVKDKPVLDIKCLPLGDSPSRPKSLEEHEALTLEQQAAKETIKVPIIPTQSPETVEQQLPIEPVPEPVIESHDIAKTEKISTTADEQLTKDFLNGDYCLQGGIGWWLYEFCNGKYVMQFHQEPDQAKTVIYLGFWNSEEHHKWRKSKKRKTSQNYVTHYYSNGDVCDLTGKPRNAQVKLKCMEGQTGQQISIYMVEPSPCEYIIGIESPIFCPLIATANDDGLFLAK
eukprot:gene17816-19594_t